MAHAKIVAIALLFASAVSAAAQDRVLVVVGTNRSRTEIRGKVVNYTGDELVVDDASGVRRKFTPEEVFSIDTERTKEHVEADKLFGEGRWQLAVEQYVAAQRAETRAWVRREIMSQAAWCYRYLNDDERAARYCLYLLDDDANSPYFDCIPLRWLPGQPSPAMEQACKAWLEDKRPAAVLIAASHLFATPHRNAAIEKLKSLRFSSDERIAGLARAQLWRADVVKTTDSSLVEWNDELQKIPPKLRAGAYFMLGEVHGRKLQPQESALAYLRVPIEYPQQRELAARCLLEAARQLERVGQVAEAKRLYREIETKHQDSFDAADARRRLEE